MKQKFCFLLFFSFLLIELTIAQTSAEHDRLLTAANSKLNTLSQSKLDSLLLDAFWQEDTVLVEKYLIHGANANLKDDGTPILFNSLQMWKTTMAKLLIEYGADINAKDSHGQSLIHFALASENSEHLDLVINSGTNLDAIDLDKETPLIKALKYE